MRRLRIPVYIALCLVAVISMVPNTVFALGGRYDQAFFSNNDILFYNPDDKTCSSMGTSVNSLVGNDNREKIWNYLTARGLSPEQAAGVLGNIQSESGGTFSPTVSEFGKDFDGDRVGYGIVQWTGGRRVAVVDQMTKKNPDLVEKYYNSTYSTNGKSYTGIKDGFVAKNANTGELMPVADNDALLLTQLDFLYAESTSRNLHSPAVDKGYGLSSDMEWSVLKRQTTIEDASNVWLYSFEIPANIDGVAPIRAKNGQSIYDIYSSSVSGIGCSSGDKYSLSKELLDSTGLTFVQALDKKILQDIVNGTNDGNALPCGVNINVLRILQAITQAGHTIRVNDLNRGCRNSTANGLSTTSSRHYAGNGSAIDLGPIDGIPSYSQKGADLIMQYAAPFLAPGSGIGQIECLPNIAGVPSGVRRFSDSCDHLHIDMQPNTDPPLKCKVPIYFGGCDESQRE